MEKKIEELKPWYQTIQLEKDFLIRGHGGCGDPAWPFILRYLEPIEGKRILDLGSNAGIHAIRAAQKGAKKIICLEAQDNYIEQAKFIKDYYEKTRKRRLPIIILKGFTEDLLTMGLGRFDTVLAISILYHVGKLTVAGRDKKGVQEAQVQTIKGISTLTDHVVVRVRKEEDADYFRQMFSEYGFENTKTDRDSRIFLEFKK